MTRVGPLPDRSSVVERGAEADVVADLRQELGSGGAVVDRARERGEVVAEHLELVGRGGVEAVGDVAQLVHAPLPPPLEPLQHLAPE